MHCCYTALTNAAEGAGTCTSCCVLHSLTHLSSLHAHADQQEGTWQAAEGCNPSLLRFNNMIQESAVHWQQLMTNFLCNSGNLSAPIDDPTENALDSSADAAHASVRQCLPSSVIASGPSGHHRKPLVYTGGENLRREKACKDVHHGSADIHTYIRTYTC
ncbi:hypothetical protein TraAM80_10428, partial [Trypanosoma rangeli]